MTELWRAPEGSRAKPVRARAVDWDKDGNPIRYSVWCAELDEPPGNPIRFSAESLRMLYERVEDEDGQATG